MRAWYRAEAPFVANVSLVVDFDKTRRSRRGSRQLRRAGRAPAEAGFEL